MLANAPAIGSYYSNNLYVSPYAARIGPPKGESRKKMKQKDGVSNRSARKNEAAVYGKVAEGGEIDRDLHKMLRAIKNFFSAISEEAPEIFEHHFWQEFNNRKPYWTNEEALIRELLKEMIISKFEFIDSLTSAQINVREHFHNLRRIAPSKSLMISEFFRKEAETINEEIRRCGKKRIILIEDTLIMKCIDSFFTTIGYSEYIERESMLYAKGVLESLADFLADGCFYNEYARKFVEKYSKHEVASGFVVLETRPIIITKGEKTLDLSI